MKLTLLSIVLVTVIFNLYPQEFRDFLSSFAPPSEVQESRRENRNDYGHKVASSRLHCTLIWGFTQVCLHAFSAVHM